MEKKIIKFVLLNVLLFVEQLDGNQYVKNENNQKVFSIKTRYMFAWIMCKTILNNLVHTIKFRKDLPLSTRLAIFSIYQKILKVTTFPNSHRTISMSQYGIISSYSLYFL